MLKVSEAAKVLNCTPQRIYLLAKQGVLKIKSGIVVTTKDIILTEEALLRINKKLPKIGRPKKLRSI